MEELTLKRAKIYAVGQRPKLLPNHVTEVEFAGDTLKSLLRSVGASDGVTLYDEVIAPDGSFSHGYSIAVNGELIPCDELDKRALPISSDVVVIHLVQIPAGG